MRALRILGPMLLAALPAAPGVALDPGDYPDRTLRFDGVDRAYDLRVPAGYDGSTAIPLVVDLHGLGSSKAGQQALSGMAALADAEGFAVVWPDGRFNSWNAGWCCGQADLR